MVLNALLVVSKNKIASTISHETISAFRKFSHVFIKPKRLYLIRLRHNHKKDSDNMKLFLLITLVLERAQQNLKHH